MKPGKFNNYHERITGTPKEFSEQIVRQNSELNLLRDMINAELIRLVREEMRVVSQEETEKNRRKMFE